MTPPSTDTTPYLYLTTTGRSTGLPRQIEIWFVEHAGAVYLVSGGREGSDWVRNIRVTPAVTVSVGSREVPAWAGVGRVVDDAAEAALAESVRAKMQAKYKWSDGLIVELKPNPV